MRTTIELSDEHRSRLLAIAARHGDKGFSKIIGEALDAFLKSDAADDERRRRALRLRGILGEKDAGQLRARATALRESWR